MPADLALLPLSMASSSVAFSSFATCSTRCTELYSPGVTDYDLAHTPSFELEERHLQDWLSSGLNEKTVQELGVRSSLNGDTWIIPIWDIGKIQIHGYRVRYNDEVISANKYPHRNGRVPKYRSYRIPNHFFYPHPQNTLWTRVARDTSIPIFITEGGKKAAKLTLEDYPAIGLFGVDCWMKRKERIHAGSKRLKSQIVPIEDFQDIRWKNRPVYIVFDSDKYSNSNVSHAENLLLEYLRKELQADCRIIDLPCDPQAKGVDDFFVHNSTNAKRMFQELIAKARTLPTRAS